MLHFINLNIDYKTIDIICGLVNVIEVKIQIFHMICLPNTQSAYLMGNDLCSFNQSTEPLIIVW